MLKAILRCFAELGIRVHKVNCFQCDFSEMELQIRVCNRIVKSYGSLKLVLIFKLCDYDTFYLFYRSDERGNSCKFKLCGPLSPAKVNMPIKCQSDFNNLFQKQKHR